MLIMCLMSVSLYVVLVCGILVLLGIVALAFAIGQQAFVNA